MSDIPDRNGDIFSNEIKDAMDRALKDYIERNKGNIQDMLNPYIDKPVSSGIVPMKDTVTKGIGSLYQMMSEDMSLKYYRCRCGKFCKYDGCKFCGCRDIRVIYTVNLPKPPEIIDLKIVI